MLAFNRPKFSENFDPVEELRRQFNYAIIGVGILAAMPIGLICIDLGLMTGELNHQIILDKISSWQTLLGGTFAVMGAVLSVRAIVIQTASSERAESIRIQTTEDIEAQNRSRELLAARAVLPIPLNALANYATDIAIAADQALRATTAPMIHLPARAMLQLPSAPLAAISDLKAFIKAAAPDDGQAVADIISELQVISAQASGYWIQAINGGRSTPVRANFESLVGRAAVLYGRLSALFPYARRGQDHIDNLSEEHVMNALFLWFPSFSPEYEKSAMSTLRYFQRRARETAPPQSPTTD